MTINLSTFVHRLRLIRRVSVSTISSELVPGRASPSQLSRLERQKIARTPNKPILDKIENFFRLPEAFLYRRLDTSSSYIDSDQEGWDLDKFEQKIFGSRDQNQIDLIMDLKYGSRRFTFKDAERLVVLLDVKFLADDGGHDDIEYHS